MRVKNKKTVSALYYTVRSLEVQSWHRICLRDFVLLVLKVYIAHDRRHQKYDSDISVKN